MSEAVEDVIDSSRTRWLHLGEIWRYRELFYFFTWRDIKIKYKQTVLGFLWAILQPLLMMIIFTLFFGRALKVPSQNLPYPVFVISGLLIWNMFSSGLTGSATSMSSNAQIIKKVYFPRLIIPVASMLVALFDFLMAMSLFIALLVYYEQPVAISALWSWPLALVIGMLSILGPGSLLAALNVKYRDFRYVIPFLVQVLFFLTPVIYPLSMLRPGWLGYVIVLSPLYAAVELFRYPLTNEALNGVYLAVSMASGLILGVIGITFFKRSEDTFADFV